MGVFLGDLICSLVKFSCPFLFYIKTKIKEKSKNNNFPLKETTICAFAVPFSAILVLSSSLPPTHDTLVQLTERTKLGLSAGATGKTGRKHLTEGQLDITTMSSMPQAKFHSDLKLLQWLLFNSFCFWTWPSRYSKTDLPCAWCMCVSLWLE